MNYTLQTNRTIEYIVIHYTANNGDTARGNANYFYSKNRNASAHYFVDEREIYQVVAEKDIAWAVGAKIYRHQYCRNYNSISIEMCSRKDKKGTYYFKDKTVKHTQELVKKLMKQYHIPLERVLRHYDVTGKHCPAPYVTQAKWENFKNGLKDFVSNEKTEEGSAMYQTLADVPEWGKEAIQALLDRGAFADEKHLNLSQEMLRTFTMLHRVKVF